jgi:hypothetical protein
MSEEKTDEHVFSLDNEHIKGMIKISINTCKKIGMDVKKFFSAVKYQVPNDGFYISDYMITSALEKIQEYLDSKLKSVGWRIILGYDNTNHLVIWHLVTDLNKSYYWKNVVHSCYKGKKCEYEL